MDFQMSPCKCYSPHSSVSTPIYIKCVQITKNQQIKEIESIGKIDSECSECFWFVYFYFGLYYRNQSQNDIEVKIQITFIIADFTSFNLLKKKPYSSFLKSSDNARKIFIRKPECTGFGKAWILGASPCSCPKLFFNTPIHIVFLFHALSLMHFFPSLFQENFLFKGHESKRVTQTTYFLGCCIPF